MTITFEIPEELASHLGDRASTLSRQSLALAALREGLWTEGQVGRFLGLKRLELDQFLKDHGVELAYTRTDLERERALFDQHVNR